MAPVAFPRFEKAINPLTAKLQKKKNYNQAEEYFIAAVGFYCWVFVFFTLGFLFANLGLNSLRHKFNFSFSFFG